MTHRVGRLGHLIVAIAEPNREGLAEYHRWFEAEHMYDAVLVGPGAFAANRYVATRDLKARRQPLDGGVFPDATKGSFVALYYLAPGSAEEHFAWSFPQNRWLGVEGRNNADRELVLTWLCDAEAATAAPGHEVPPHVALDHPYPGLVMAWVDRTLELEARVAAVPGTAGVAQTQVWSPRDFPPTEGVPTTPGSVVSNPAVGRQALVLLFLEEDPRARWDELAALDLGGEVRLLAPWIPVVRGTTRHLDELW